MKKILLVFLMSALSIHSWAFDKEDDPELYQELLDYCQSFEEEGEADAQSLQLCIDEEYQYILEDQSEVSEED